MNINLIKDKYHKQTYQIDFEFKYGECILIIPYKLLKKEGEIIKDCIDKISNQSFDEKEYKEISCNDNEK